MKISIIVPSYNQGQFIAHTIYSILLQSYRDFEILVMDGASTDSTLEVLNSIKDDRLIVASEPDDGQTQAINKGFRAASGDIVCWMNSDDVFMPNSLASVVQEFKNNPRVDVLSGDKFHIDEGGMITSVQRYAQYDVDSFANDKMAMCNQACFWKRELFNKIGYLDETIQFVMDLEYFVRMGNKESLNIKHIPQVLGAQRYYDGTKTSDNEWIKVWDEERTKVLEQNKLKMCLFVKIRVKFNRALYHIKTGYWHYIFTNRI